MQRLDRDARINFVDLTEPTTSCPFDRTLMLTRFHATTASGETISGAAAFAAMWREMPLLRPLGQLARFPGVLPVLERAYLLFLKIRPAPATFGALARQLLVSEPRRAVRCITQTATLVFFIGREVAFEPFDMAVAFECEDVRR